MRAYDKIKCRHCEQMVSTNGLARTAHAKMHVKEGTLVAIRANFSDGTVGRVQYVTPEEVARRTARASHGLWWERV